MENAIIAKAECHIKGSNRFKVVYDGAKETLLFYKLSKLAAMLQISIFMNFWSFLLFAPNCNKKFVEPTTENIGDPHLSSSHGHFGDIISSSDINSSTNCINLRSFAAVNQQMSQRNTSYDSLTSLSKLISCGGINQRDIRNSESYKEYYAMASGTIPPKTKGSKKKANTDTILKTEKKSGKGKQKTISEAELTEAEQLKIITKRSRQETHSSRASVLDADE
ncbi:hypothetical protein Tco_0828326 [Tanacetum coccineum]